MDRCLAFGIIVASFTGVFYGSLFNSLLINGEITPYRRLSFCKQGQLWPQAPKYSNLISICPSHFAFTKKVPSYIDWVKLPFKRLAGFSTKKNDVIVFNFPEGDTVVDTAS
jgi:hypothetical protein